MAEDQDPPFPEDDIDPDCIMDGDLFRRILAMEPTPEEQASLDKVRGDARSLPRPPGLPPPGTYRMFVPAEDGTYQMFVPREDETPLPEDP